MPDWLSLSVAKDILLSAIALYGAVLSTFNFIQATRKDRRAIVVKVGSIMPAYGDTLGDVRSVMSAPANCSAMLNFRGSRQRP